MDKLNGFIHISLLCYAIEPNDYDALDFNKISAYDHFESFLNEGSYLQDISDIKNLLYCLDDACGNVDLRFIAKGYNDPDTISTMQRQFFQLCQHWLIRNHHKVEAIFASLFD